MIGLDDIVHTSYRITRDTLRVLAQCLDPRNARDYCLKCDVPPFMPSAGFSERLQRIEENLADPDATTAQDLADLLRIVDELAELLTAGSGARDRGIQFAIQLMLPAMLYVTRSQRGPTYAIHLVLLGLALGDQRLKEAYPQTTTYERLVELVADIARGGALKRLTPDPTDDPKEEEWKSDVLVSLLASAIGAVFYGAGYGAFLDYGLDHPAIEGLDETLDSARHAFAMFIPGEVALEQADYAAFQPQGPPFRRRATVASVVPLVGNEIHGGGLWLQADQDFVFEFSETASRRVAFTLVGQGGALMPLPASQAIDLTILGALAAKFELRIDDPDAATWSNTEIPKGVSVRARRLSIQLEAGASGDTDLAGSFDVRGTARVEQAELVVGKLPLIGSLVRSGFRIAFDAGIVASLRKREFRFEGGLATELVIPINRRIPLPVIPLTVRSVTVRVAARTGGTAADAQSGLTLQVTANLSVEIFKAITAHADGLGFEAAFKSAPQLDGNLAGFIDAGWKPVIPNGVGLSIGWGSVRGSGFIGYEPATERLSGSVSLDVAKFKLRGLAVSDRTPDERNRSWMIVASLEFPSSGGGGITIDGIGLLFGSNRRSDPDAFLAGLGAGHLDAIVLPGDPVPRMAALTSALGALFPPSNDGEVVGVIFKISALAGKLKVALGIIVDNGGTGTALKFYIVVRVLAAFPSEDLATLRIEAHGVAIWDAEREEFNLRIVLRNSTLFGGELTGEASAFSGDPDREDNTDDHTWLVSFGGFNPRYQVPAGIHVPKPLQLTFARGDHLKIELRLYFAVTPGAVHFGASVDLVARFSGFGIHGRLTIDVLLTKFGLRFIADIQFTVELKLGSRTLAGIGFKGTLKGFYPAELSGRVSVSFLFWTWTSPRIVATLEVREEEEERMDPSPRLIAAIRDTRNWDGGGAPGLLTRPGDRTGVWVSPSAPLTFRQGVLPLERTITRCGSASLPAPTTFTAEPLKTAGARWESRRADGEFAPGLYVDLSEEESLSVTSFVAMPAGFVIERPFNLGPSIELDTEYELVVIDSANPKAVKDATHFSSAVMNALAECAPSTRDGSRQSPVRPLIVRPDKLAVVTETLAPVAVSIDYLEAIARVRTSGDTQRIVPAGEAA